ncbi:MAG: hypothetical protein LBC43_04895 [Bifidobacteriaceae bacterium]|jgi:hypothetical protein|nr:hypothetical protein [Bifidobacteriaceae bacterium]
MSALEDFLTKVDHAIADYSQKLDSKSPQLKPSKNANTDGSAQNYHHLWDFDQATSEFVKDFTLKRPTLFTKLFPQSESIDDINQLTEIFEQTQKFQKNYNTPLLNYCEYTVNLPQLAKSKLRIPVVVSDVSMQAYYSSKIDDTPKFHSDIKKTNTATLLPLALPSPLQKSAKRTTANRPNDYQLQIASPKRLNPLLARHIFNQTKKIEPIHALDRNILQNNYTLSSLNIELNKVFELESSSIQVEPAQYIAAIADPSENTYLWLSQIRNQDLRNNRLLYSPVIAALLGNSTAIEQLQTEFQKSQSYTPKHLNQVNPLFQNIIAPLESGNSFSLLLDEQFKSQEIFQQLLEALSERLTQVGKTTLLVNPNPNKSSFETESILLNTNNSNAFASLAERIDDNPNSLAFKQLDHPRSSNEPSDDPGVGNPARKTKFQQARQTILDYAFELHRINQPYGLSLFEAISEIVNNDQYNHSFADLIELPSIDPKHLLDIYQGRHFFRSVLTQLAQFNVFTHSTLNNPWAGAHIDSNELAENIKTKIYSLNNDLLPKIDAQSKELESTFPNFKFKTLTNLATILSQLSKLVEIYDTFKLDIINTDLNPYLNATSTKPIGLGFFERRALIKEVKNLVRPGIYIATLPELHDKLVEVQKVTEYFNQNTSEQYKSLLPANLNEILTTFDSTVSILATLETLLPDWTKLAKTSQRPGSFLELDFYQIKVIANKLQKQSHGILDEVELKAELLDSVRKIQPLVEYFYQIGLNHPENLPEAFYRAQFNLSLYSSLAKLFISTNAKLAQLQPTQLHSALDFYQKNLQKPQAIEFDQAVFNQPLPTLSDQFYDYVIFNRIGNTSAVSLWPYIASAKHIIDLRISDSPARKFSSILPTLRCEISPKVSQKSTKISQDSHLSAFAQSLIQYLEEQQYQVQLLEIDALVNSPELLLVTQPKSDSGIGLRIVLQLETEEITPENIEQILKFTPERLAQLGYPTQYYTLLEFLISPKRLLKRLTTNM